MSRFEERIMYIMRKPTDAERRIWPMADHAVEPVPRSCMPPPRMSWHPSADDVPPKEAP